MTNIDSLSYAGYLTRADHGGQTDPLASCSPGSDTHTVEDGEIHSLQFRGDDATIDMGDNGSQWANTSLGPAMEGNILHLNRITPEMIKDLSPSNLNAFMDWIGTRELDVSVNGRSTSLNGATGVAAMMWASGDSVAFAKAFAASPENVLEYLTGNGARVLTAENMALIMREMSESANYWIGEDGGYDPGELDALGSLVQIYLEKNAGNDPDAVSDAILQLIDEVSCTLDFSPENAGVLNGVLIAGMIKHFDAINASDATRNEIIGHISGTLSAGAGAFGPWGAVVGAAITALNGVYQSANPPRDFSEIANRTQGAIQLQWLQHPPEGWDEVDAGHAIDWLNTTLLNNGKR